MSNYKTPGVYIEEISTLPASVAPVATAIPAFVGYTEERSTQKPVRITSLLEYREHFGESMSENYGITLTENALDPTITDIAVSDPAGKAVSSRGRALGWSAPASRRRSRPDDTAATPHAR